MCRGAGRPGGSRAEQVFRQVRLIKKIIICIFNKVTSSVINRGNISSFIQFVQAKLRSKKHTFINYLSLFLFYSQFFSLFTFVLNVCVFGTLTRDLLKKYYQRPSSQGAPPSGGGEGIPVVALFMADGPLLHPLILSRADV